MQLECQFESGGIEKCQAWMPGIDAFASRRGSGLIKQNRTLSRCGICFHAFDSGLTSYRSGIGTLATGAGSTTARWRGRFHTDAKSGKLLFHIGSPAFRANVFVLGIGFFQYIKHFPTVFAAVLVNRHFWQLLLWFFPGLTGRNQYRLFPSEDFKRNRYASGIKVTGRTKKSYLSKSLFMSML